MCYVFQIYEASEKPKVAVMPNLKTFGGTFTLTGDGKVGITAYDFQW